MYRAPRECAWRLAIEQGLEKARLVTAELDRLIGSIVTGLAARERTTLDVRCRFAGSACAAKPPATEIAAFPFGGDHGQDHRFTGDFSTPTAWLSG